MNNRRNHKHSGFSLIELTVVVTILSMMAGGWLAMMTVDMKARTMRETRERIVVIKSAMAAFKKKNGRLPCPAAMNAPRGSSGFGVEVSDSCSTAAAPAVWAGATVRVPNAAADNNPARIGAVPFVTLGISALDSIDGWHNRFLYAVSEKLADKTIPYDEQNGAITLEDGASPPNISGPNPNHTPFVLLSLGETGFGGYTHEGVARPTLCTSSGPLQQVNCDMTDAVFRSTTYSTSKNPAVAFDHIVTADLAANDPTRICGDQGMLYGPGHAKADANGCVPNMVEAANGNVGIGTSSSTSYGTASTSLTVHGAASRAANLVLEGDNNGVIGVLQAHPDGTVELSTQTKHPLTFTTDQHERVRITNDGNVGIGTTTPNGILSKLDVHGSGTGTSTPYPYIASVNDADGLAGFTMSRSGGPTGASFNSPGGTWAIYRYGSSHGDRLCMGMGGVNEPFCISTAGNVGIGTTTPATKLDVAGYIKIGQSSAADCTAAIEGAQRYNATAKNMEFCNGTAWTQMGGAATASSPVTPLYQCPSIAGVCVNPANDMLTASSGCNGQLTTNQTSCSYDTGGVTGLCGNYSATANCPRIN